MSVSLVPDINRITSIAYALSDDIETDLINFISNQEQCRRQWEKCDVELKRIKKDDIPLKEQNRSVTVQLELARNQLDNALRKRPVYEKRIKYLEQQLHAIASLLNDPEIPDLKGLDRDAILRMTDIGSSSVGEEFSDGQLKKPRKSLIPSDFDDSCEETLESHLVRVASNAKNSMKRRRPCNELGEGKKNGEKQFKNDSALITISPESSISEKQLPKPVCFNNQTNQTMTSPKNCDSLHANHTSYVNDEPSAPLQHDHLGFQFLFDSYRRNNFSGSSLYPNLEEHHENNETVVEPYTSKFFDCHVKCHENCKVFISTSCFVSTNKIRLEEAAKGQIPYKVPAFILDCVKEIEKRGLHEQGLYRVPGALKEITNFKKKLRHEISIDLAKITDINTITSLLKAYLRELAEPVITRQYHAAFLDCGKKDDLARVYKLIDNIPIENRHTLAFLFLHFRKVGRTQENLMDFKALARVLGPAIVGNSCLNPTSTKLYEETQLQPRVIELLFGISDDYWAALLNSNNNSVTNMSGNHYLNNVDQSKNNASSTYSPLLGRIDGVHSKSRQHQPRYPVSRNVIDKLGKKKYFDSPTVKL